MWRRQNRKRPSRAPLLRLPGINWSRIVIPVAVIGSVAGIYLGVAGLLNRPIDTLVINGSFQRVSARQMEALVEPYARAGFLHTDLTAVRAALRAMPWVAEADVRRRWPGTLVVNVTEETPVACWGEQGLLNAAGELFLPQADHVPAELPRLRGPTGSEALVTSRFFKVQEQLAHRGMAAVALTLDARGAWTLRLNSGVEVRLGANGVEQRIGRFLQILDGVLPQMSADVAYVDMRYPNGFAIGWKQQQAMQGTTMEEPGPNA